MAHVNAEIAKSLVHWDNTGEDVNGVFSDGKRKGFIQLKGSFWALTDKGRAFISKWASARGKQ